MGVQDAGGAAVDPGAAVSWAGSQQHTTAPRFGLSVYLDHVLLKIFSRSSNKILQDICCCLFPYHHITESSSRVSFVAEQFNVLRLSSVKLYTALKQVFYIYIFCY